MNDRGTRAPLGASLKAVAVIAAVVVIGWAVLYRSHPSRVSLPVASASRSPATSTAVTTTVPVTTTTPTTVVPPSSVKLQVLNGVGVGQLATRWSEKLRTNPGYDTLAPANATSTVSSSAIYIITPGYLPEADSLATAVGLTSAAINPTIPPPASAPIPASARANANLVLVIGPDLENNA